jgi:hypothetical protein
MNYKEKYLKYKMKYIEIKNKLNQTGGIFVIPEKIKSLIRRNQDGSLNLYDSLESFLSAWIGQTKSNQDRREFLTRCIIPLPDCQINIIDARGDGNCFYECIFMFLSMTQIDFPFENHEQLKEYIIGQIETDAELRENYGDYFEEILKGIKDPNCPDLDIPISKVCSLFEKKLCSINFRLEAGVLRGYVRKYGSDEPNDCITIFVSNGHVYLVFPTCERGSSISVRQNLFDSIDGGARIN